MRGRRAGSGSARGAHGHFLLAASAAASRLVAKTAQPGRGREQSRQGCGAAARTCSQLSSTSSSCRSAQVRRAGGRRRGGSPALAHAERSAIGGQRPARDRAAARGRRRRRRRRSPSAAIRGALERQAGLADPAGAGQRQQADVARGAAVATTAATSRSRPTNGVGGQRQLRAGRVRRLPGRRGTARDAPRPAAPPGRVDRPRASASSRTVSRRGARRAPRSRSLIPRRLSPARSASASWERAAALRNRRRRSPNAILPSLIAICGSMRLPAPGHAALCHLSVAARLSPAHV